MSFMCNLRLNLIYLSAKNVSSKRRLNLSKAKALKSNFLCGYRVESTIHTDPKNAGKIHFRCLCPALLITIYGLRWCETLALWKNWHWKPAKA